MLAILCASASVMTNNMPLDRTVGTSLYRQLFLLLRDEIARGEYTRTGALPKEEDLCQRFDVSRATVRRALANLAALGLVERRHGLGTFVRPQPGLARSGPSLTLVDGLRKTVRDTDVEVLSVGHEQPPTDVRALLQIGAGSDGVHAIRLRSISGIPVMLTDSWLPSGVSKRVTSAALRKRALYEILLEQGVRFGRVVQEISAQSADPVRAAHLRIEVGSPMLKLVRLLHDLQNQPVQHLTVYMAPERSRILMDFGGDDINTLNAGQIVHDVARQRSPSAGHAAPRNRSRK